MIRAAAGAAPWSAPDHDHERPPNGVSMSDAAIVRLPTAAEKPIRQAPANVEAEQALLGAILVNNDAWQRVSDFLKAEHFSQALHQRIYDIASSLIQANKIATPVTVKTFLASADVVDLDVPRYLAGLAAEATTIINAEDYGRMIYDLALRRALIGLGEDVVNRAYDSGVELTPGAQIEEAEKRLYELAETGRTSEGFQSFGSALTAAIHMANAAFSRDGRLAGLATGLSDLDAMMGGLQKSDLIILAGRPGMGKTALATNIAFNVAKAFRPQEEIDGSITAANGGRVGFFSLEMSAEQLATRILAEQSGISSERIRRGKIDDDEFTRIVRVSQEMAAMPLWIDQTGGISIAQLAARARRLKRQRGLDMLVVDYLQLLGGSSKRSSENRVQEITEITTGLKALAKELAVPVIALSQLSRQVENREDKRPQLSDLRESGSIEQDADVVVFVFREEYYHKNKKPKEGTKSSSSGRPRWSRSTAAPRSSSASSATARPARWSCTSTARSRASRTSRTRIACRRCADGPRRAAHHRQGGARRQLAPSLRNRRRPGNRGRGQGRRLRARPRDRRDHARGRGLPHLLRRASLRRPATQGGAAAGHRVRAERARAGSVGALLAARLRPVIGSGAELAEWRDAAPEGAPFALHVDTGMHRLGLRPEEIGDIPTVVAPTMVMSHLVSAETPSDPVNAAQIAAFARIRAMFPKSAGSLSNSSGIFLRARHPVDEALVRPGYALYGGNPTPERRHPLSPVVTLEASVVQVRAVRAGKRSATTGSGPRPATGSSRPSRSATPTDSCAPGRRRPGAPRASPRSTGASSRSSGACPWT